jgi:hypothetical protein
LLFAVTAVVFTVQVPVEAFVAQENEPDGAAEHVTTEGFAPVPVPAQFVKVGLPFGAQPVQAAKSPAAVSGIPLSVKVQVVLLVVQASKSVVAGTTVGPAIVLLVVAPLAQVVVAVLLYSAIAPAVPEAPTVRVGLLQVRFALPACV